MSVYSVDSLENVASFSDSDDQLREDRFCFYKPCDFVTPKTPTNSLSSRRFYMNLLQPQTLIQDASPNETAGKPSCDKVSVPSGNAIIGNDGTTAVRKPGSVSSDDDLVVPFYAGNVPLTTVRAEQFSRWKPPPRAIAVRPKMVLAKKEIFPSAEESMKADKKLGNVLAPKVETRKKPGSYLDLYRERLGVPRNQRIRSPEGSTLSIYGDAGSEPFCTEDDSRVQTSTSRDDQSELSFYRHLMKQPMQDPRTSRSYETVRRRTSSGASEIRSVSDYRLSSGKQSTFQPYNLKDYKSLSVPYRADRSLGPDKFEMQEKWGWLVRRRTYGDSVNARNRQHIVRRSEHLKSKRTAALKHHLLPLKDDGSATPKQNEERCSVPPSRAQTKHRKHLKRPPAFLKIKKTLNPSSVALSMDGKSKSVVAVPSNCSLKTSTDASGDPQLETLQQRHLNEKKAIDVLINHTLFP